MKIKLQPTVLAVALAASFNGHAVVYKIENIDEFYKVNGTIKNSRSGFGVTLNNSGTVMGGASGPFAPMLTAEEQQQLTDAHTDVSVTQLAIKAANSSTNSHRSVKLIPQANHSIFNFDMDNKPAFVKVFDEIISNEESTRTVSTVDSFALDINDSGIIVGTTSSVAYPVSDPDQSDDNTDKDSPFYVYDYAQRAMVIDQGDVFTFIPEFNTYGGQSGLTSINESGLVVGYASTGIEYGSQTRIEDNCLDSYKNTVPLQVCARGFSDGTKNNSSVEYYLQAYSWQYNQGELINPTPLGILATPIDDKDQTSYNSIALDVNNKGIAVGRSITFRHGDKQYSKRLNVATVYKDNQVIDLMDHDEKTWSDSTANAINNNDLVVGYMEKSFNGFKRKKFFIYDVNSETTTLSFPNDFSNNTSDLASVAKHINDNNEVVGSIEIDSQKVDAGRRTHGFLYNHNTDNFQDINDLLTCESKGYIKSGNQWQRHQFDVIGGNEQRISYHAKITVVDASKIAEDGTIIATALVTLPKVKTQWVDDKGNIEDTHFEGAVEQIVVDANNEPVFDVNIDGEAITEQIPRAVILKPTVGESCSVIESDSAEYKQKRQGAGVGVIGALLLLGGVFIRRFR